MTVTGRRQHPTLHMIQATPMALVDRASLPEMQVRRIYSPARTPFEKDHDENVGLHVVKKAYS